MTTALALDEAVRRIGMERGDLVPADGVDTLAEEGYLLIGQYGQAVVTFDGAGAGRFLRDEALAKGCDRGVVQWDFYNLMVSYSSRDGGGGWGEESRDDKRSSEEMVAALRRGPSRSTPTCSTAMLKWSGVMSTRKPTRPTCKQAC